MIVIDIIKSNLSTKTDLQTAADPAKEAEELQCAITRHMETLDEETAASMNALIAYYRRIDNDDVKVYANQLLRQYLERWEPEEVVSE